MILLSKVFLRDDRQIAVYHNTHDHRKQTILFIHSIGMTAKIWQGIWRDFQNSYNILSFDLYGHGSSEGLKSDFSKFSAEHQLKDMQDVLDKFTSTSTIIVASGYNSTLACQLAKNNQKKIVKVVLLEPKSTALDYEKQPRWLNYPLIISSFYFKWKRRKASFFSFTKGLDIKFSSFKVWHYYMLGIYSKKLKLPELIQEVIILTKLTDSYKQKNVKFYHKHLKNSAIKELKISSFHQQTQLVSYFLNKFINKINIESFRNLSFEGGGIRAMAYVGAIQSLDTMGVLKNIKRVAGASAGAVYSSYIALGYTPAEIKEIVLKQDYTLYSDRDNIVSSTKSLLSNFGWYKGDAFVNDYKKWVADKTGNPEMTFLDLYNRNHAADGNGIDLYIIGSNLNTESYEVYSYEHTPDMKLADALRISVCIPLFFKAVKQKVNGKEFVYIDGAMTWNYPIELFDDDKYIDKSYNGENIESYGKNLLINHESIGFRLDPLHDTLGSNMIPKEYKKINGIVDFGKAFLNLFHSSTLKRHLSKQNWKRTIFIDTFDVEATEFTITKDRLNKLIQEGENGVFKHFKWRLGENGLNLPK